MSRPETLNVWACFLLQTQLSLSVAGEEYEHLGKNSCQREPVPIRSLQIFCHFVVGSKHWYALVKCSSSDNAWLLTSCQGWDKHCQKPKWASIWQSVHCTICIPKLLQKPGASVDPCHIPPLCNPETENIARLSVCMIHRHQEKKIF